MKFFKSSILCIFFALNNKAEEIARTGCGVVNNTNSKLQVTIDIEAYSKVLIQVGKISKAQYLLYQGITSNSAKDVKDAITAGADVNTLLDATCHPLTFATLVGSSEALTELLDHYVKSHKGFTDDVFAKCTELLDDAVNLGDAKSALCILKKISTQQKWLPYCIGHYFVCLNELLKKRDIESMIFLLRNGQQFIDKNKPILNRNEKNDYKPIQDMTLYSFNIDDVMDVLNPHPSAKEVSLYLLLDLLQELINLGYKPNKIWSTDSANRCYRLFYEKESILELFIKNGANVNCKIGNENNYSYPIFAAIDSGNWKAVRILLDNGAFVNQPFCSYSNISSSLRGKTPLTYSISSGKTDIVKLLLAYGAKTSQELE